MKLTINKAWELCLKQWKWIAKQIRAGDRRDIRSLKRAWCRENGFGDFAISVDCFFCEYDDRHPTAHAGCNCPAMKVDKTFSCENSGYDYRFYSLKFYAKLLELNRKRNKNN